VQIEDLGSSNGTFLNGKRILRGEAKVGDELAFDVLRFRVAGASTPEPVQVVPKSMRRPKPKSKSSAWPWVALVLVLAAAGAAALVLMPL